MQRKNLARTSVNHDGSPMYILFTIDFMSVYRGNTPKYGDMTAHNESSHYNEMRFVYNARHRCAIANLNLAGRVGLKSIAVQPQVFTFFILITLRREAPTLSFKSFGKHLTS